MLEHSRPGQFQSVENVIPNCLYTCLDSIGWDSIKSTKCEDLLKQVITYWTVEPYR